MNLNKTNNKLGKTSTLILPTLVVGGFLIPLIYNFDAFFAGFKSMF
ncbi:hypothetical protein DI53_0699 [Sphingobacterium deserti]|uniref:Uncharacterized protein n=1 Tax=Sphingobacterium deserti TaxID=1229276 RepID=A0A0B8TBJ5_9SPHI|nr:hypothetical protein DI53_0699 [Sphingobacterium deserti]